MINVSIITYNQEKYIAKAIESVLAQEVNFKYEIIIGDDCSSDGTREILRYYENKYPDIIQLILHPRRYDEIPGRTNNMTNLYNCRGKYIAMLDGDDYWVSKDKLQRQVDFLEQNPDYVITFHDTLEISEHEDSLPQYNHEKHKFLLKDRSFTIKDVASGWFMQTSTLVFKNHLIGEFPEWFRNVYSADYALHFLLSKHGNIFYFKNLLSVRLLNKTSFTARFNSSEWFYNIKKEELKIFKNAFKELDFSRIESSHLLGYAIFSFKQKSYFKALYYLGRSFFKDQKYFKLYLDKFTKRVLKKS